MKSSEVVMSFPRRELPLMARIRQDLPSEHISDVRSEARQKLIGSGLHNKIKPGNRIAITAGSRGMGGLVELLSGTAEAVKSCGGEPFIIPAMGSHGGATPEGQAEILRRLGVNESSCGAPIRATMETHERGPAENGAGAVDTPMLWNNPNIKSGVEKVEGAIGKPEDIAAAICFLAGGEARFITGTNLTVDGSWESNICGTALPTFRPTPGLANTIGSLPMRPLGTC